MKVRRIYRADRDARNRMRGKDRIEGLSRSIENFSKRMPRVKTLKSGTNNGIVLFIIINGYQLFRSNLTTKL